MTLFEEFKKEVVTSKMSPLELMFVTRNVEYIKWSEKNCISVSSILARKKELKKDYKKK